MADSRSSPCASKAALGNTGIGEGPLSDTYLEGQATASCGHRRGHEIIQATDRSPLSDRTTENFVSSQALARPRGSNGIAGFTLEARRPGS